MRPPIIETNYPPILYRKGLPYRLRGSPFSLRSELKSYKRGDDVVGWQTQSQAFNIACKDDPGWLCYIVSNSTVDNAKHIAANIMQSYEDRGLETNWLRTIDSDFKANMRVSLYIMDTLFVDDTSYRRSLVYDTLRKIDGPETSAIVIGKADNPNKFVNYLGLKPHLLLNVK